MTEQHIPVVIGTVAMVLAAILILMRASVGVSRVLAAFSAWWMAASNSTSTLVVIGLAGIAVTSFANMGEIDQGRRPTDVVAPASEAIDPQGLGPLRAYARKIDVESKPAAATPADLKSAELSDVDTMIAKLAARLEKEPDDVKGWKMLGWSYLNMERPEQAIAAYERALKLDPNDAAIGKALEQAKAARTGVRVTPSVAEVAPTADAKLVAAESRSVTAHDSMIRGMVDQLAARLEVAPADEAGWLQLIRSRVTLDEKDAAKVALAKALDAFAGDAAAKDRLVAVAAELGIRRD